MGRFGKVCVVMVALVLCAAIGVMLTDTEPAWPPLGWAGVGLTLVGLVLVVWSCLRSGSGEPSHSEVSHSDEVV